MNPPRVFISYLWEREQHKAWIRQLAEKLTENGVNVRLDQWHLAPGESLTQFMETEVRLADYVLIVCTPAYAAKSDQREGGVGYEQQVVSGEIFSGVLRSKFIPLIRSGSFKQGPNYAIPSLFGGITTIDMRNDADFEKHFSDLLRALIQVPQYIPPPIGSLPEYMQEAENIGVEIPIIETDFEKIRVLSPSASLTGHKGKVWWVAITADGKYAVSGSDDRTVCYWDVENEKFIRMLQDHSAPVMGVAITKEGDLAVSGSWDSTVRVWSLGTGESRVLRGHTDSVNGVAIVDATRKIITGSADCSIRIWNRDTGKTARILPGHEGRVVGVAASLDGKLIVSGSEDGSVKVWDADTGNCLHTFWDHKGHVYGVAISSDGKTAVSGSSDRTVRVWDIPSRKCKVILPGHAQGVKCVSLTPDGSIAASASHDGTVRLWDIHEMQCIALLEGHLDKTVGVSLAEDGRTIVSGSYDGSLKIWKI